MNPIQSTIGICLSLSFLHACVTVHKYENPENNVADHSESAESEEYCPTPESTSRTESDDVWKAVQSQPGSAEYQQASSEHVLQNQQNTESETTDAIHIGKVHLKKKGFQTMKSLSEKNIFMQKYDYSCGAASLATIMHFYFGDEVTERKLLEHIQRFYTPEEYKRIEEEGLSFLELEQIAKSLGYQTASVRLKMSSLEKLRGPVVVFVARDEYRHFAVLKGIFEDRVFIADPSRGNIRMSREEFAREWDGRTFILGKKGVASPQEHAMSVNEMPPLRKEIVLLRTLLKRQQPIIDDTNDINRYSNQNVSGE